MDYIVKILGKTYSLSVVDKVDDQDSLGKCNDVLQRILVKSGQKPDQAMDTVKANIYVAQLQDDDGNVMSANDVKAFIATLP